MAIYLFYLKTVAIFEVRNKYNFFPIIVVYPRCNSTSQKPKKKYNNLRDHRCTIYSSKN